MRSSIKMKLVTLFAFAAVLAHDGPHSTSGQMIANSTESNGENITKTVNVTESGNSTKSDATQLSSKLLLAVAAVIAGSL
ncbi:hypothetical protein L0F63_003689 [Massospora cicadina]|nr:hypothetical protein L0F63_003689 [Massospora cicadina]